jgi:RNA polymerase sigma-70 factor, ECF subfamily
MSGAKASAVCIRATSFPKGHWMEFCAFDRPYLERLRAGDFRTQEHFASYFGALIQIKMRSRVRAPEDIEDIRQETFSRVLKTLRTEGGVREPEKLGAFVNAICNNVRNEFYRSGLRETTADDDTAADETPDPTPDALQQVMSGDTRSLVQQVIDDLPERDRRVLRAVMLEERDKDEVCRELGVDREYLRVLLHRARISFKDRYLERTAQPALRR